MPILVGLRLSLSEVITLTLLPESIKPWFQSDFSEIRLDIRYKTYAIKPFQN